MGYSTSFTGQLTFDPSITEPQLAKLETFFGEDPDRHSEWLKNPRDIYSYIQFELTKDRTGIRWDYSEKFYQSVEAVNLVLLNMRAEWPDFNLTGELLCQGEDIDDRWRLVMEGGKAVRRDVKIEGAVYECPHCGGHVATAEARKIS